MRRPGLQRAVRLGKLLLLVGGGALALSSCSGSAYSIQAETASPLLAASTSQHTVNLQLLAAAPNGASPFNFNGASDGHMTVTVPLGWKVDATCTNYSTTLTHSCAIVRPGSSSPAFPGSEIANAREGLRTGKGAAFSFVASSAGRYQIVCLVPGHRELGMWDWFVVRPGGQPSIVGGQRVSQPAS